MTMTNPASGHKRDGTSIAMPSHEAAAADGASATTTTSHIPPPPCKRLKRTATAAAAAATTIAIATSDVCTTYLEKKAHHDAMLSGKTANATDAHATDHDATTRQNCPLLNLILDDALTALIFTYLGPYGTSQCAATCTAWHRVSMSCPLLWKLFVQQDFGLNLFDHETATTSATATDATDAKKTRATKRTLPSTTTSSSSNNDNCHAVYTYLALQHRQYLQQQQQQQEQQQQQPQLEPERLDATVVFADDGGNFPGYPPSNALRQEKSMVWCTRTGVDRNVDLVVHLRQVSLVTGFLAANGGRGYSAPLKEGLVFVSMDPPNLEAARCFDDNVVDDNTVVPAIVNDTNNNNNSTSTNIHHRDPPGRRWVQYLFQESTPATNGATGHARPPTFPLQQQPRLNDLFPVLRRHINNNNNNHDENGNDQEEDDEAVQAPGIMPPVPVPIPDEEPLRPRRPRVPRLQNMLPRPLGGDDTTSPQPQRQYQYQHQQQRPPSNPNNNGTDPVASFWFPNLQHAYHGQSQQWLPKPMVGRYIHLKLLSSHSPPGLEHISDNIDLMHFHTMGIPVPGLEDVLSSSLKQKILQEKPLPKYQRRHAKRPQDPPPNVDLMINDNNINNHDNNNDDDSDHDDNVFMEF